MLGDRHRRLPRRQERPGIHRRGRAHLPAQDRRSVRQARGGAVGARRGLRLSPAGRHRRRPRRRLAGAHRSPRAPHQARRDAAARRARAAGQFVEIDQEGREDRRESALAKPHLLSEAKGRTLLRRRRHLARARPAAHVAARLSAACHARLRDPGQRGVSNSPAWCTRRRRNRCRGSRSSPMPAGRSSPMRRWCSSTWCASASRRTSSSPRSACARGCSTRCSAARSASRIR